MNFKFKEYSVELCFGSCSDNAIELIASKRKEFKAKIVQLLSADVIASKEQLLFALSKTFKAFKNKSNYSKSMDLELLNRISGLRQVNKAIDFAGFTPRKKACLIIVQKKENKKDLNAIKKLIEFKEEKINLRKKIFKEFNSLKKKFNISDLELKARNDLKKEKTLNYLIIEKQLNSLLN